MKTLITNELFWDFIECKYRGYLKIAGASGPRSDLVDVCGRLREGYHSQAREHLLQAYRDEGKQVCADVGLSVILADRRVERQTVSAPWMAQGHEWQSQNDLRAPRRVIGISGGSLQCCGLCVCSITQTALHRETWVPAPLSYTRTPASQR